MTTADHLADLYSALDSAHSTMALSSQDWSASRDFAWLYGILVGWSDGEGDALPDLAERFGWSADDMDRLRRLRAAVAGFDLNLVGDLGSAVTGAPKPPPDTSWLHLHERAEEPPTWDAYHAASKAVEKHRERADRAEAEVARLRELLANTNR